MAGEETHEALQELTRLREGDKINLHVHAGTPIEVPLMYKRHGLQLAVGKALVYPDGGFAGEILAKEEVEGILSARKIAYISIVWDPPFG